MKRLYIVSILTILLVLDAASCSVSDLTPAISTQISFTPTNPTSLPHIIAMPTITVVSNTGLSTPTQIDEFPRPTLSAWEAKILLLGLVRYPKNCRLPCLWNLEPGNTSIEAANDFVSQFGYIKTDEVEIASEVFENSGGVGISYKSGDIHIVSDLSYYKSQVSGSIAVLHLYSYALKDYGSDPMSGVTRLAPIWATEQFNQEMQTYLLSTILKLYGPPDQVLVGTWSEEPDYYGRVTYRPFSLVLLYLQHGFMIEYQSIRGRDGEDFTGCPDEAHIKITSWDPKENLSITEIGEKASFSISFEALKPIEEVTDLTIDIFYAQFMENSAHLCIHTPAKLWQLMP